MVAEGWSLSAAIRMAMVDMVLHYAGELVGKSHRAERKFMLSAPTKVLRKAFGIAAEEDQFTCAAVAKFAQPLGERVRIEILSGRIKKDDGGGAIGVEFLKGVAITELHDFDGA